MSKSNLSKNHVVVRRNTLNEIRPNDMGLQELRFFTIYLSKINPMDESTRLVRFSIGEFQAIMELGRINKAYLRNVIDSLLTKVIGVPDEKGTGMIRFQLFKKCRVSEDNDGEWYVEIDAHDDALPLMFDFKGHYFKYELWNALRLKSKNQLRMYEILKQYEKIGYRTITIQELKEQLGIKEKEYPRYKDFNRDVLRICQHALSDNTDISYTYEPHGKRGIGGKILQLKFIITRNKNYIDPLSLDKFISGVDKNFDDVREDKYAKDSTQIDFNDIDESGIVYATGNHWKYEERIAFLSEACNHEFSREEIIVLYDNMPDPVKYDGNTSYDHLLSKYREMDMRKPSASRFGYLKKIIKYMEV